MLDVAFLNKLDFITLEYFDFAIPLANRELFVVADGRYPIAAHASSFGGLDHRIQIPLGMNIKLLMSGAILEAYLVEFVWPAARRAPRFDAASSLVFGQGVGRHIAAVINAADD